MSKPKIYGKCHLCNKTKKLSFEHVPPKSCFNDRPVKLYHVLDIIGKKEFPWETEGLTYKNQQQGKGGYYLCQSCNSYTGKYYVPYYSEFIIKMFNTLKGYHGLKYSSATIRVTIRPLPIIKQIMTMFVDINGEHYGDSKIRDFLLDKESTNFSKKKHRIFCYIYSGSVEKCSPLIVKMDINTQKMIVVSEIASFPLGFCLYEDLLEDESPPGYEITYFTNYSFDEEADICMELPVLENNTMFAADYRTKEEIINTINETNE